MYGHPLGMPIQVYHTVGYVKGNAAGRAKYTLFGCKGQASVQAVASFIRWAFFRRARAIG
jgi:hypothetical protein